MEFLSLLLVTVYWKLNSVAVPRGENIFNFLGSLILLVKIICKIYLQYISKY